MSKKQCDPRLYTDFGVECTVCGQRSAPHRNRADAVSDWNQVVGRCSNTAITLIEPEPKVEFVTDAWIEPAAKDNQGEQE